MHCNYPAGAGAVLVIELDGAAVEVAQEFAEVERLCRRATAPSRSGSPADAAERALIWKGRKSAFAAVGPDQPRLHRPGRGDPAHRTARGAPGDRRAVRRRPASGWPTCSTPATATCTRSCSSTTRLEGAGDAAEKVSGAILDLCIEHGGSITGEHGVGVDKAAYMPRMFTDEDLDTMQLVRCAFDPQGISNPGKVFPTPRLCGEVPGRHKGAHPLAGSRTRGGLLSAPRPRPSTLRRARPSRRPARTCTSPPTARTTSTGCRPRWSPAPTSTEQVAEVLRAAAAHGLSVVPRGAGTKITWGTPPRARRRGARRERDGPGRSTTPPAT